MNGRRRYGEDNQPVQPIYWQRLVEYRGVQNRRERLADSRLYAITPEPVGEEVEPLVKSWLEGGVDMVQLRAKTLPRGRLLSLAQSLRKVCADAGVLFIVNDHLDVAMLCGADGVHLGEDDLSLSSARMVAGSELLIGASAATPVTACQAEAQGADYLGVGAAFATPIKPSKAILGLAGVAEVQQAVQIPVFAIGGIDLDHIDSLRRAGLGRVGVIRALAEAENPAQQARAMKLALAR
jgi:thiamine-phosphate pyrophosphorylase